MKTTITNHLLILVVGVPNSASMRRHLSTTAQGLVITSVAKLVLVTNRRANKLIHILRRKSSTTAHGLVVTSVDEVGSSSYTPSCSDCQYIRERTVRTTITNHLLICFTNKKASKLRSIGTSSSFPSHSDSHARNRLSV